MVGYITCDMSFYTWTIEDFSQKLNLEEVESPVFAVQLKSRALNFDLILSPKNEDKNGDYIGMFIYSTVDINDMNIYMMFSILDSKMNKVESRCGSYTFHDSCGWGLNKYVKRSFILDKKNDILRNDQLVIRIEFSSSEFRTHYAYNELRAAESRSAEFKDFEKLLFDQDLFPDVSFKIDDKKLLAHRNILASRSSVFRAMFEHEMQENTSNLVVITDIKYDVMQELLRFIYAAKVNDIDRIAIDLLAAANKYDVKGAKSLCEASLAESLCNENAIEYLKLADMHEAAELKTKCVNYIVENSKDLVKLPSYKLIESLDASLLFMLVDTFAKQK